MATQHDFNMTLNCIVLRYFVSPSARTERKSFATIFARVCLLLLMHFHVPGQILLDFECLRANRTNVI